MTTTITIPLEFDLQLTLRSPDAMAAMARALSPGHVSTEPQAPASVGATLAEFGEGTPQPCAQLILPHKPGTHWPEHDAWYAGPQMGLDGSLWHVLVPAAHLRTFTGEKWSDSNVAIAGADSTHDGMANTQAMADAGNKLAQRIQALGEGLYIPAPAETLLMLATLKSVIGDGVLWTSRQSSAGSAWVQYFSYGTQYFLYKVSEWRAVPVRRLSI